MSDGTFEIAYATSRLARVRGSDRESAKRRFAAFVLYDDTAYVESDVVTAEGEDARVTPSFGPPPVDGDADEMRAWLKRHDEETEAFEIGLFEDRERALGPYLQLLAANDPWRLEGHGSRGRILSGVPVRATLVTFDDRIAYEFDATQYVDYVRLDTLEALDLTSLAASISVDALVDVAAMRDAGLRQIASSYETIARERLLTARYALEDDRVRPFDVRFDGADWRAYIAHRRSAPERFLPPPGWTRP